MKATLHTVGDGYWSRQARAVEVIGIELGEGVQWEGEDRIFGELRVYFDTKTWDTSIHGLIYTDNLFIAELREFLNTQGLPGDDIEYSEQGMQGDNYVSLDADTAFYEAWMTKFSIERDKLVEIC